MIFDPERFLPGRHAIDGYGSGGFRFADMSHQGSILALPSGIRAWSIQDGEVMTLDLLTPALREAASLDYLLVGSGLDLRPLGRPVLEAFAAQGLSIEVMPTSAAARTYNVLVAENRRVGAALVAVP